MQLSMEIDRLHVVQDLFGDKSSRGFLTLVPGALLSLIYFHLIRHCMLHCLDHVSLSTMRTKEFFIFDERERVGRLIKDHKMESVQQQRLLMIPHGHSSTFVSFFCPRNSLIISPQYTVHSARSLLQKKTTLEAPFCILMNFATRNLISCRYTRKINMWSPMRMLGVVSCWVLCGLIFLYKSRLEPQHLTFWIFE